MFPKVRSVESAGADASSGAAEQGADDAASAPAAARARVGSRGQRTTSSRRRVKDPARAERIAVENKLSKARTTLTAIRRIFVVMTAATVLWALAAAVASEWQFDVTVAVFVGTAILMVAGSIFFYAQPVVWTLVLACVFTALAVVGFLEGTTPVFDTLVALFLWAALPVVVGIARLRSEYPDLVDTEKLKRRTQFKDAPTSAALAKSEQRRAEQRSGRTRMLAWVAGSIVVVLGVGFTANAMMKEDSSNEPVSYTASDLRQMDESLRTAIDTFRSNWRSADFAAIESNYAKDAPLAWYKVERSYRKRGWWETPPVLGNNHDIQPGSPDSKEVWFGYRDAEGQTGTIKSYWEWKPSGWQLFRLRRKRD